MLPTAILFGKIRFKIKILQELVRIPYINTTGLSVHKKLWYMLKLKHAQNTRETAKK